MEGNVDGGQYLGPRGRLGTCLGSHSVSPGYIFLGLSSQGSRWRVSEKCTRGFGLCGRKGFDFLWTISGVKIRNRKKLVNRQG